MTKRFFLLLALFAIVSSCSLIRDDEVVAKLGRNRLYRSELERYIPVGVSGEDSLVLAGQYINSWARTLLFNEVASRELSKSELDVEKELSDYRNSLVRYRYEQRYVNERLDTVVTEAQINEYYNRNKERFELESPILKVRFLDILKDSRDKDEIIAKMASSDFNEGEEAKELAFRSALRYFDKSDEWISAETLAREFGTDVGTMLSALNGNYIRIETADKTQERVAFVCDLQKSGIAPVEYCSEVIRDVILNRRKHEIVSILEQDLLENAQKTRHFVIY